MFAALTERYRGQKGLGAKQVEVLGFFTETARLKGVGQTTMPGGGGSPPMMTHEKNAGAVFKRKAAPGSSTSALVVGYGQMSDERAEDDEARFEQQRCARPAEGRAVYRSNGS